MVEQFLSNTLLNFSAINMKSIWKREMCCSLFDLVPWNDTGWIVIVNGYTESLLHDIVADYVTIEVVIDLLGRGR